MAACSIAGVDYRHYASLAASLGFKPLPRSSFDAVEKAMLAKAPALWKEYQRAVCDYIVNQAIDDV